MKFYIPLLSLLLINSVSSEICYRGGMKNNPASSNVDAPPCWYKMRDGSYSCFEFVQNKCPFPAHIDINRVFKKPRVCYRGNMKKYPVFGPKAPPCWYREADRTFSCYELDPKTHRCPFPKNIRRPQ